MRYATMLLLAVLMTSCATSGMTSERQEQIPQNATTIKLHSDKSADALYQDAYRHLREEGFRMAESNKEMRDLSTEAMDVGSSQTTMRVDLFVEPVGEGSVLTATAEHELTRGNWRPVAYKESDTKYKASFEELALLIQDLPHERLNYVVDKERTR